MLPLSRREIVKEEGDLLWPELEGRATLAATKGRLGAFGYACQYLRNPVARGGNLFKVDWFGTFREAPKFDCVVQSWDCAFKTGAANDYSACVTLGVIKQRRDASSAAPGFYLLHAWHGKVEFFELKRRAVELYEQWRPNTVLVEDAASGQSLVQELRSDTILPIKPVKLDEDKIARANSVTPALEGGRFFLSEGAAWVETYRTELTAFPGGAHDDLVDATVQALSYLRESPDPNLLIVNRDQVRREQSVMQQVRQSAPNISAAELARFRLESGCCHRCGESLFMKTRMTDGPGEACMDCWRKAGGG